MRCWGVVLREFQSVALVSVSTAISFALLRAGERRDPSGRRCSTHENGPRKGSAFTATQHDPFEIRGFGPIFPPSLVQQAEPSSLWITYRAFPRNVYSSRLTPCCMYLLTFSADLSSVGKKMNQPLSEMSYLSEMCVYSHIACLSE